MWFILFLYYIWYIYVYILFENVFDKTNTKSPKKSAHFSETKAELK